MGRTYYGKQVNKDGEKVSPYDQDYSNEPTYKDGIRLDRIVNKNLASRGSKAEPKRTNTSKPSLKQQCPFQIILRLEPGHHVH